MLLPPCFSGRYLLHTAEHCQMSLPAYGTLSSIASQMIAHEIADFLRGGIRIVRLHFCHALSPWDSLIPNTLLSGNAQLSSPVKFVEEQELLYTARTSS